MPKIFGREMHPGLIAVAGLVAAYLVYGALQPEPTVVTKKKAPPVAKKTTNDVDYTKEDFSATFASLSTTPKDAFRPLISKTVSGGTTANPSIDNFTYSGMAELNNDKFGLLENTTTGEGDFVKPGQRWHQQWLVVSMNADQIQLQNDLNETTTLKAGAAADSKGSTSATPAASPPSANNAPVNPNMVGAIGGDVVVQPDVSIQMGPSNRGRGRRGGGRNRGGGGMGTQGGMNDGGN